MQHACHAAGAGPAASPATVPSAARSRRSLHHPPCSPSTSCASRPLLSSSSSSSSRAVRAAAGKDGGGAGQDDKLKREHSKADFSALWAQRVKSFMSGRRKYLQSADAGVEDEAAKAFRQSVQADEAKLEQQRQAVVAERRELLREEYGDDAERLGEQLLASDLRRASAELQTSPLTKMAMAVVHLRDLIRTTLLLPFTLASAGWQSWQQLFASQRYENFLMSEGERVWYWRNRMENERWFWEMFAWDRLLFPVLAIASYEFLVPNHFMWAVVVPAAMWSWLAGKVVTPATPEFWLIAYLGFWRKCWPEFSAWAGNALLAW